MKESILVDTGIVVQYLKTGKGVLPVAYEKFEMHICAATYTELLASKTFVDSNLEKEVMDFCDKYFKVKSVSKEIASQAAGLIRTNDLNLASALIAATALNGKMKLLTEDKDTFDRIEGLEMASV